MIDINGITSAFQDALASGLSIGAFLGVLWAYFRRVK